MTHILVVVDMQQDFVDGALGSPEAAAIVPHVCRAIRSFDGPIAVTYDTHGENYMDTAEGRHLPVPHCIRGSAGWELDSRIAAALEGKNCTNVEKPTFGSTSLPQLVEKWAGNDPFDITVMGLCTDICVVSNALLLKAHFPETPIYVDAAGCAGVTPESHRAALTTMKMCQIDVIHEN